MRKLTFLAVLVLTAGNVHAQTAAEQSGVNSVLGRAPTTEDFVVSVASSDMFEIASSKLALERGDDATKTFAQQMLNDHQRTTSELSQLITTGKVPGAPKAAMNDDHKETLDDLSGRQGADFLASYHAAQVEAHEDAVDLFGRYASDGDNPDLKAWAAATLPALKHHLDMAKTLEAKD